MYCLLAPNLPLFVCFVLLQLDPVNTSPLHTLVLWIEGARGTSRGTAEEWASLPGSWVQFLLPGHSCQQRMGDPVVLTLWQFTLATPRGWLSACQPWPVSCGPALAWSTSVNLSTWSTAPPSLRSDSQAWVGGWGFLPSTMVTWVCFWSPRGSNCPPCLLPFFKGTFPPLGW